MTYSLFLPLLLLATRLLLISTQGDGLVTVMYRKRMQHIAEMNYLGILSVRYILDVGASDGRWTEFASQLFPASEFFLIDGNPHLLQALQRTGRNFEVAVVGSEKGQPISFVEKAQSTTLRPGRGGYMGEAAVDGSAAINKADLSQPRMTTTTIDEIASQRHLPPFQLIRFNLRGEEFSALQGAIETLRGAEFVLIEVPMHQYHPGAATLADLNSFLALCGFRMYDIMDLRYSQPRTDVDEFYQVPTLVQFDVLWAREDSAVFTGANYPPPPTPKFKYALDSDEVSEERKRGSRDFVMTQISGEVTAVPLTSAPLVPGADEESKHGKVPSSTAARKTTTFRRKKRRLSDP